MVNNFIVKKGLNTGVSFKLSSKNMVRLVLVVLLTIAVLFFNGLFLQVLGMSIKGQFGANETDEVLQQLNLSSCDSNLQFNASNQSAFPEGNKRHRNWTVALQRQQRQWKTLKGKYEYF